MNVYIYIYIYTCVCVCVCVCVYVFFGGDNNISLYIINDACKYGVPALEKEPSDLLYSFCLAERGRTFSSFAKSIEFAPNSDIHNGEHDNTEAKPPLNEEESQVARAHRVKRARGDNDTAN